MKGNSDGGGDAFFMQVYSGVLYQIPQAIRIVQTQIEISKKRLGEEHA